MKGIFFHHFPSELLRVAVWQKSNIELTPTKRKERRKKRNNDPKAFLQNPRFFVHFSRNRRKCKPCLKNMFLPVCCSGGNSDKKGAFSREEPEGKSLSAPPANKAIKNLRQCFGGNISGKGDNFTSSESKNNELRKISVVLHTYRSFSPGIATVWQRSCTNLYGSRHPQLLAWCVRKWVHLWSCLSVVTMYVRWEGCLVVLKMSTPRLTTLQKYVLTPYIYEHCG